MTVKSIVFQVITFRTQTGKVIAIDVRYTSIFTYTV